MKILLLLASLPVIIFASIAHAADEGQMERGSALYTSHCAMCHQANGIGVPPAFPPLAKSDWLMADRARSIKVLAEGLQGKITVNDQEYDGMMPAQMLNDQEAADVMTFITNSWGNEAEPFTAEEVKKVRSTSRFSTYEMLVKSNSYSELPAPPEGWELEEIVRLDKFATRLAGPGKNGEAYLLKQEGGVDRLTGKALVPWLSAEAYLGEDLQHITAMGMTLGPDGYLWITTNQRIESDGMVVNDVNIWRSEEPVSDSPPRMKSWFQTELPYGVGPFNHGVSHLAFGPDGNLWVSSGSRTDSGEPGEVPNIAKVGETNLTACLWRFDNGLTSDKATGPPQVIARGLRNPYGFAWDDEGNLFTVSNGPGADLAEEMDFIEEGKHYGFPFQFAEKSGSERFYQHTPEAPAGIDFTYPLENVGPDGGKGDFTFHPHSSPGGIVWCDETFPEPLKNRFVMARFGNLLSIPEDCGFDVLTVRPFRNDEGKWQAEVRTLFTEVGRPIDVLALPDKRVLVLEYSRATNLKGQLGLVPGRIIQLRPAQ